MFVSRAILPPPPHILDLFPVAQNLMAHLSPMRRSQGVTEMRPGTETRGGGGPSGKRFSSPSCSSRMHQGRRRPGWE